MSAYNVLYIYIKKKILNFNMQKVQFSIVSRKSYESLKLSD